MKLVFVMIGLLLHLVIAGQKTTTVQVILCDSIPKAITPNGDNINDFFSIEPCILNDIRADSFSLKIFNRWGELVFENNDFRQPWNGKDKKDKPVPTGVYVYLTRISSRSGLTGECKGSITLIR